MYVAHRSKKGRCPDCGLQTSVGSSKHFTLCMYIAFLLVEIFTERLLVLDYLAISGFKNGFFLLFFSPFMFYVNVQPFGL